MTYHEASKTSQTEARATSDWTPTLARIEELEAEVERLGGVVRAAWERENRLRADLAISDTEHAVLNAQIDGLVAEIERLTKHRDTLSAMIDRLSTYLDGVGLNSWTNGACWAAERAVRDLKAEIDRLQADNDRLRDETDWTLFDMAVNAAARAHVEELQEKVRLRDAALQRVRDLAEKRSKERGWWHTESVSPREILTAVDGES